jgi:hypothetical protein
VIGATYCGTIDSYATVGATRDWRFIGTAIGIIFGAMLGIVEAAAQ